MHVVGFSKEPLFIIYGSFDKKKSKIMSTFKGERYPTGSNDFTNPVGSVDIYGIHGSVRHTGNFSLDNPWLDDMQNGANNQDIDAAYERAANWEADRQTLLEQRAYDESRLAEQREYDSPLQQIARERAAGINRDVAGGSGSPGSSGSSAQLQSLPQPQTQAQTKFSNNYDNTSMVLNGINTAVNVVSSLGSFANQVIDGVTKIAELSSRLAISKTAADVATSSVDSLVSKNNNASIQSAFDTYSKVSPYITNDTTDEDALLMLQGLTGMSDEDAQSFLPRYRAFQKSPAVQKMLADNELNYKRSKANNMAASSKVLRSIAENAMEVERLSSIGQIHTTSFATNVAALLDNDEIVDKTVDASSTSLDAQIASNLTSVNRSSLENEQINFAKARVAQDIIAFTNYLKYLKSEIERCDQEYYHIMENEPLTEANIAYLQAVEVQRMNFELLGSSDLNQIGSMSSRAYFNAQHRKQYVGADGQIKKQDEVSDNMMYYQPLFHQYLDGTMTQADIATHIAKKVDQSITQQRNANDLHMQKVNAALTVMSIVNNALSN